MSDIILQTRGLTKRYAGRAVVDSVNLTVRRGEIYGFLGPNGAGKTTTIRMALGLVQPTSGSVQVLGQDATGGARKVMRRIGALVEGPAFYPNLTAAENVALVQKLKGTKDSREVKDLMELVGLSQVGAKRTEHFSLGMKQRLGLAMALVGKPDLLILDEPQNGLDPEGFREMRSLLRYLVTERQIGILLSSHLLQEVELIANRVGVIREGRLLTEATVDELRAARQLEVGVDRPEQARQLLKDRLGIQATLEDGRLAVASNCPPDKINALLVGAGFSVHRLAERAVTLEEIFFTWTKEGATHA